MNPLVTPDLGLVVWTSVAFLILFLLLRAFAWKPIMTAIGERESSIEDALKQAEAAKDEMARLTNENDQLLKQARAERDLILREAKSVKDAIIAEAKEAANKESAKIIEKAKIEISNQTAAALAEVKTQVATLSIEIAEKVLRAELEDKAKQENLVAQLLKEVKIN